MATEYQLYLGLDTNGADVDAELIAFDLAAEIFPDGHTFTSGAGRHEKEDGTLITEDVLILTWFATKGQKSNGIAHKKVNSFVVAYKDLANQKSVLIRTAEVFLASA